MSQDELSGLVRFSGSTYFNDGDRPKKVELLLGYLAACYPYDVDCKLSKEVVFSAIFEDEPFNPKKLEKISSESVAVFRKYIAISNSGVLDGVKFHTILADFFSKKQLESEFVHSLSQSRFLLGTEKDQDEEFYLQQLAINKLVHEDLSKKNDKKTDNNLAPTMLSLDLFYIISKLKYCLYLLLQKNRSISKVDEAHLFMNEVLQMAKIYYSEVPICACYVASIELFLQKDYDEAAFFNLKKIVKNFEEKLSKDNLSIFHSSLRNYVTVHYNKGNNQCLKEINLLYKEHFKAGTVYLDGINVATSTIKSAINVALKLGEHEWPIELLHTHRYRIAGPEDSETIYQFNLANCYFHSSNFNKVENILLNHNFKEIYYKLAAKRLEIKLHYETNSPLLEPRVDAFKIFVHEQKKLLPPETISPNNHFVDLLRQIIAPQTWKNSGRIHQIHEKLETFKAVAEREWLQQKLAELNKKA